MRAVLLSSSLAAIACVVADDPTADFPKAEARVQALQDREHGVEVDYCALHDWYLDGACDDFCSEPDPDCELHGQPPCGGVFAWACDEGERCDYPSVTDCGEGDALGSCVVIPTECTQEHAPVCGCDGRTHGNACTAARAAVSVAHDGPCGAPL